MGRRRRLGLTRRRGFEKIQGMENALLDRFPGMIGFPVSPFSETGEFDGGAFQSNVEFMLDECRQQ